MNMEMWKDIPEYEGTYQVSSYGNIKSLLKDKEIILKGALVNKKYLSVCLSRKSFLIHRLVAMAFHENPNRLPQVNHMDGNKINNHSDNLEWCTPQQNIDHGFANGLMHKHKGATHHFAKLTINDVLNIRFCREKYKVPYYIIAEFYDVSKQAIMDIIKGKNWGHV